MPIIQINATMIVGILIFYTIPYIAAGGPHWNKESKPEKAVLTLVPIAITLFNDATNVDIGNQGRSVILGVAESATLIQSNFGRRGKCFSFGPCKNTSWMSDVSEVISFGV